MKFSFLKYIQNIGSIMILIIGILCIPDMVNAQIRVTHVDGRNGAIDREGLFYSLPQTHLKVEVVIERTEKIAGPLAAYAEKYLGVSGILQNNQVSYAIKDVRLSSYIQPDPAHLYYVQIDKKSKENKEIGISLNEAGILLGVNTPVTDDREILEDVEMKVKSGKKKDYFSYFSDYNFYEKVDTVVRRISVDTFSIEKYKFNTRLIEMSPEMKAKEIAEKLDKIRDDRYLLLTGYQEINYGEGMKYMGEELKKMEAAYLSLFTGYTKTEYIYRSYTILPTVDKIGKSIPVFKFSASQGIGSSGSNVSLMIRANELTKNITRFLTTAPIEQTTRTGFFYRVPEHADVQLVYNGRELKKDAFVFGQFGHVARTTSLDAIIEFHPTTGGVKQMKILPEEK